MLAQARWLVNDWHVVNNDYSTGCQTVMMEQ
jgi:hypothetical protein